MKHKKYCDSKTAFLLLLSVVAVSSTAPPNFDWRSEGVQTSAIYDQGFKAEAGVFAAVTALELNYQVKYGKKGGKPQFSTQQVFDCLVKNTEKEWSPAEVFEYIKNWGAISTESDYPQVQGEIQACRFDMSMNGIQIVGSPGYKFNRADETQIKELVYNKGPITVSFNLLTDFFSYREGIYSAPSYCQNKSIAKHTLVIVGYGTENGVDFWWVQNSWGSSWGIGGYAKIKRGDNTCDIS